MPDYSVQKAALLSVSTAGRRPVREGGHPQQRGTPGPDADRRLAGAGRACRSERADASQIARAEVFDRVGSGRPIGRMAEPEEIAVVVAFLCSPRSSYVTGAAWSADGGTVPVII